jgi:methionine-rich copper-binding protein CopC
MSHTNTLRIAVSLALALAACGASAHALLKQATPAVGGTVATSPSEIRIKFSEGVEPRFSSIAVATAAGAPAPIGKPSVDPADASVLIAPVAQPLKPGVYKVTWHVVSTDTHKTQGSFEFTVAP